MNTNISKIKGTLFQQFKILSKNLQESNYKKYPFEITKKTYSISAMPVKNMVQRLSWRTQRELLIIKFEFANKRGEKWIFDNYLRANGWNWCGRTRDQELGAEWTNISLLWTRTPPCARSTSCAVRACSRYQQVGWPAGSPHAQYLWAKTRYPLLLCSCSLSQWQRSQGTKVQQPASNFWEPQSGSWDRDQVWFPNWFK